MSREDGGPAFEQIVQVTGAYDERDPDPSKNYGIGACRIRFILKGPKGAVQFMVGTDWYLPAVQKELRHRHDIYPSTRPEGWDVGYHALTPQYEGQQTMECDLVPGGHCYYDGSGLRANQWVPDFIAGGTDWLWPRLERMYREMFEPDAMLAARSEGHE